MRFHSVVLLVVFLTVLTFSESTRVHTGDVAALTTHITGQIQDKQLILDEEVLRLGDGNLQTILDRMPAHTKLLVTIPEFRVKEPLTITKPVHITTADNLMGYFDGGLDITSNDVTIGGFEIEGYTRDSPKGVIHMEGVSGVTLKDIKCSACYNSGGPACISSYASSATLSNVKGIDNHSGGNGGVLFAVRSDIKVIDSTFERNWGTNGGAIYSVGGKLTISNSKLKENDVQWRGGAISVQALLHERCQLEVFDTRFDGNSADLMGGAIEVDCTTCLGEGSVKLSRTFFKDNSGSRGGAIWAVTGESGKSVVSDSTFIGNRAKVGSAGAGYFDGKTFAVSDSHFKENGAVGMGGGILLLGVSRVSTTSFIGNTAAGYEGGGGILASTGNLTVIDSMFARNQATSGGAASVHDIDTTIITSIFKDNDGGAVYGNGASVSVTGSIFSQPSGSGGTGIKTQRGERSIASDNIFQNAPVVPPLVDPNEAVSPNVQSIAAAT